VTEYQTILFDLDGTLTDPKPGITKSIQYALAKFGIQVDDLDSLTPFIGPPLVDTLQEIYNFTPEQADQAVVYYREYFGEKGLYDNAVYPGIVDLLTRLKAMGKRIVLATSKPSPFAEKILAHFDLAHYFDRVAGSTLDSTRIHKADVIEFALEAYPNIDRRTVAMVGDRKHDIHGAKVHNLDVIAVGYGYGTPEEFQEAQPTYIVNSVQELGMLLGIVESNVNR
jgi:phosphoglycolate phosphatase